jgi:hypothetical protein
MLTIMAVIWRKPVLAFENATRLSTGSATVQIALPCRQHPFKECCNNCWLCPRGPRHQLLHVEHLLAPQAYLGDLLVCNGC